MKKLLAAILLALGACAVSTDWKAAGLKLAEQGETEKALECFNAVIRESPSDPVLYVERAALLEQQGKIDAAIADYGAALKLDPQNPAYYNYRGLAWAQKGDALEKDYVMAVADFTAAITLAPAAAWAYANRGDVYAITMDFDKAVPDFKKAIELQTRLIDRLKAEKRDSELAEAVEELESYKERLAEAERMQL